MNKNQSDWSRRKFSKAIISAQLLIASGALALPLSCLDEKTTFDILDKESLNTLKKVMDELIPASNKMPSASSVGFDYIMNILNELPEIKSLFELALQSVEQKSQESFQKMFSEINQKQRIEILENLEVNDSDLFSTLRNFTNESYYLNESVWPLIGYNPHPTGTLGPKMEPFDESLLDRMKSQPQSFTQI